MQEEGAFNYQLLESIFHTSKKTIQEYVREIERHNHYKSIRSNVSAGVVFDDRGRLIDLYDACLQQDGHLRAVIETLESQILGDRYMLARQNEKGKYVKDIRESQKIQGSQFDKVIRGEQHRTAQRAAGSGCGRETSGDVDAALGFDFTGLSEKLCAD